MLQVGRATATYETPMFKGRAVRRDVVIDVELVSTATVPISSVELGVFLGASLRAVEDNRASALPTTRFRELDDGGIAFRETADVLIAPGTTRHVRVERTAVPLDRDLSTVTAVVAGCKSVEAVGDATLTMPPAAEPAQTSATELAALALVIACVVVLAVRWLR
ncbi:hypothetical protein L6R52_12355 [Myxococcota bacterium]|nr:hypothetical protein [Myxococcota bacterium]